jgi:hypothetical protein
MVRALLAGRKTQTRRLAEPLRVSVRRDVRPDVPIGGFVARPGRSYPAKLNPHGAVSAGAGDDWLGLKPGEFDLVCPYASGRTHLADHGGGRKVWTITPAPDQRLWVRETWGRCDRDRVIYRADDIDALAKERGWVSMPTWKPSIYMPRVLSRISLRVTGVRVERLQEISEEDAGAEGVDTSVVDPSPRGFDGIRPKHYVHARDCFADLWDAINGKRAPWSSNPWAWAVSFEVVR